LNRPRLHAPQYSKKSARRGPSPPSTIGKIDLTRNEIFHSKEIEIEGFQRERERERERVRAILKKREREREREREE